MLAKFDQGAEAWFLSDTDRPAELVVITKSERNVGGTFRYQLRSKDTGNIVTEEEGVDWFAETRLSNTRPEFY